MGRDDRNFGCGRTLANDVTCNRLASDVADANGTGTATAEKVVAALHDFRDFLSEQETPVKCLENVTQEIFNAYAANLAEQVDNNDISASTATGRITALNQVFKLDPAGRELRINASEYGITRGDRIALWDKSNSEKNINDFKQFCADKYQETLDIRFEALSHAVSLQAAGGLRFEESCKIKLLYKDFSGGRVDLQRGHAGEGGDGVKNGQPRNFAPACNGIEAFRAAQDYAREHAHIFTQGSLIPGDQKYELFRDFAYNTLKEANAATGNAHGYHANRHAYAHASYAAKWEARTGHAVRCPVAAGCAATGAWKTYAANATGMSKAECYQIDREIRQELTEELGHHRIDVTNSYCGSSM